MWTMYVFTVMFTILSIINVAMLVGVCYTGQSTRVIFVSKLASSLMISAAIICWIVTIALYLGIA